MHTPRSGGLLRRTASPFVLALLTACGDGGIAPLPSPPPVTGGHLSHRADATLDSLFAADAPTLDSALVAEGRALDAHATAWLDSVTTALVPDPSRTTAAVARVANRAGHRPMRDVQATDASADRTFIARAVVPTRGGPRLVTIDMAYHLTVTRERIQLSVMEADVVHDARPDGSPRSDGTTSYLRVHGREMTVVPCPDATGRSVATWKADLWSYGQRADSTLAGPESWIWKTVERAVAKPIATNVNDEAYRRSFDYHFAYDVEHQHGSTFLSGGAEVPRSGVAIANAILPVGSDAVSGITGDYHLLADMRVGGVNSLHFGLGDDMTKMSGIAQRIWRGGRCVEVQEPGGAVQPASPGARITLRPVVVHHDGTRPAVPIEARASGGAVSPDGVLVPAPATVIYTAPATGGGRVDFRTVSRRGIGWGSVALSPLETGGSVDYQSTTKYTIDSRGPLGEVTTGSMHGTQQLKSRLTLVPAEPDEDDDRTFTILAVTDVRVDASGSSRSHGPAWPEYEGEASFSVVAAGTSSDPGTDHDAHDHVRPEQFPVDPEMAGQLKLFRHDWRDYYAFDLGLSGVVAAYRSVATMREVCDRTVPASTRREEYDNTAHRFTAIESDPGSCWPSASDTVTYERPYAFGAIGLDRRTSDPVTARSEMFIGSYDARTGVIEGAESVTVHECLAVAGKDPLRLATLPFAAPSANSPVDLTQGTCTLQYTVRWRFLVPPR